MVDSKGVALVTGTSSGFGRLIVQTLARQGYGAFASMRETAGRNATASAELRALADKERLWLRVLELDVTDEAAVERAVAQVIEQAGRIDVLVNNAGFSYSGMTEAYTVGQAQRIFDTNFFGAVRMNRAVLPHMRRQGSGLLIHVSSGAGRVVLPGSAHYCASKFALEALAESYRYDLAGLGIDSVIIEPGAHPTPIFAKSGRPADPARAAEYGRLAEIPEKVQGALMASQADPQEVANAALELIETPFGKRPLRRVVGPGMGALQALNDHAAQLQEKLVQMFGVAELVSPRASEPRPA